MSDAELETVTAGGATEAVAPPSSSNGSEPSTVVMIGHGSTQGTEGQTAAGPGGKPGNEGGNADTKDAAKGPAQAHSPGYYGYAVAGAGSRYSFDSEATVLLSGSAQSGAGAINLVNSSLGDSASGFNLWSGKTEAMGRGPGHVALSQRNDVSQSAVTGSHILGWSGGGASRSSHYESAHALTSSSAFAQNIERLRTLSGRTIEATASVSVDNPRITIPDTITPDPVTFGFEVRKTVRVPDPKVLPGDESTYFTFNFSVTGAELRLPTVDLTGPSVTANKAEVRLPDINLGSVYVRRGTPDSEGNCKAINGCIRSYFDLGTLKGRDFTLNGPIEIIRNPFYNAEIDIPVGIGAAGYGTGTATFGESSDRLSFAARLDLSNILKGLDLDLFTLLGDGVDLPVVGEASELVGSPDLTDFLPEVQFNPVIFEQTNPGFTFEASGGNAPLCWGPNTTCIGETVEKSSEATLPEHVVESGWEFNSTESRSAGFAASYRAGATVAEAEGGYIIVGGAGMDVTRKASIGLGGAQSGMAVVNSVNVSATVVGNALNIGRAPSVTTAASQGNTFIQHR